MKRNSEREIVMEMPRGFRESERRRKIVRATLIGISVAVAAALMGREAVWAIGLLAQRIAAGMGL